MSDYSELKRKADIALSDGFLEQEEFRSHCRASVIGRLIEEREQFHKQFEIEREFKLKTYGERDQLKAEVERLTAHIAEGMDSKAVAIQGMARLTAENESLRKALKDLLDLYDTDEGCRSLPQYIAGRVALCQGEQS